MTLVIRASVDMTNPAADTPMLPNLTDGLLARWRASDISQGNNTDVFDWIANGQGSSAFKHLTKSGDTAHLGTPKYFADGGPGGSPRVRFNNYTRLRTNNLQFYEGPKSIVILLRPDSIFPEQSVAWPIVCGEPGYNFRIEKSSTGNWMVRASDTNNFTVSAIPFVDDWMIAVIDLQQTSESVTNAIFNVNGQSDTRQVNGTFAGIRNLAVGMTYTTTNPTYTMQGDMIELLVFDRILTDIDRSAIFDLLKQTYNL